jgi:hypothetical protein
LLLTHDELLLRLAHIHKLDFAMQFVNGCLLGVSWNFQGMSGFVSFRPITILLFSSMIFKKPKKIIFWYVFGFLLFECTFTSFFKDKKSYRSHKTVGIRVFLLFFCLITVLIRMKKLRKLDINACIEVKKSANSTR